MKDTKKKKIKEPKDFKRIFLAICEIKEFVITLNSKDLEIFKMIFYNQDFPKERIDMLWNFIWGDIDLETLTRIFKNTKLI